MCVSQCVCEGGGRGGASEALTLQKRVAEKVVTSFMGAEEVLG